MKTYPFVIMLIVLALAVLIPSQSDGSHVYADDAYPAPGEQPTEAPYPYPALTEEAYPAPELTPHPTWVDRRPGYILPTEVPAVARHENEPTATPAPQVSWIVRAMWAFMELIR